MTRKYIEELTVQLEQMADKCEEITDKDWVKLKDEKGKIVKTEDKKPILIPTKDYVIRDGKRIYAANSQYARVQSERDFWANQFDSIYKRIRHQMHLLREDESSSPIVKGLAAAIFDGMEENASMQKENYLSLIKQVSEKKVLIDLGNQVAVWQIR